MATIEAKKSKQGEVTGYRVRTCVGRNEQYKQVWRTCTIPRPEGLTPAKERKEVQRLADEWERQQKAEYERTHSKEGKDKITLARFISEHWWPDHVMDGRHTPSTVSFFKYMSNDIIAYFGPKKRLNQIDAEAVKRYIKYLNSEAKTRRGEPLKPANVQHHFATLRNVLEYARRFHYIQSDPCQDLSQKEKPHRDKKKVDFLEPDAARKFLRCLEGEPLFWRAYFNLLITTGLRRGEALALKFADIDKDKMTLNVSRNVTIDKEAPDKINIGNTKTGESRTVPLSPRLYGLLVELKREHETRLGAKLLPSAFIFCRPENPGTPIYPTTPTRVLAKLVKRYGLPDVSPHDLRHSAASLALEAGANLREIQELLGHRDPSTTLKFYSGLTEEAQRRTVEGIENLIVGREG